MVTKDLRLLSNNVGRVSVCVIIGVVNSANFTKWQLRADGGRNSYEKRRAIDI